MNRTAVIALLAVPLAGVVLTACTRTVAGSGTQSPAATASSTPTPTPTPSSAAPSTSSSSAAPAPAVDSASASYPGTCTAGQSVTPTLTWQVSNASGAALSVDDPNVGSFGNFPPTGSTQMPVISCDGAAGTQLKHTYLVATIGGTGPVATETVGITITVQAAPTPTPTPTPPPTPTPTPTSS